jgi:very-short-patch-repair endonuclease
MRNLAAQQRARALRENATDTERFLWSYLRRRQLHGHRFRRQVPVGNYVADFVCLEKKLIIEVDGSQHDLRRRHDEERSRYLEGEGFRVLRFWDNEVFNETQAVLHVILEALEKL